MPIKQRQQRFELRIIGKQLLRNIGQNPVSIPVGLQCNNFIAIIRVIRIENSNVTVGQMLHLRYGDLRSIVVLAAVCEARQI